MKKNHNQYINERREMAVAVRSAAHFNMHEAIANHFSCKLDNGEILLNPQKYFPNIRASDFMQINPNDLDTPKKLPKIDPTAWALHGAIHRQCPEVHSAFHVHSVYATILASMEDPHLPAIDQNSAVFFERVIIDEDYGGLAFDNEGEKVAHLLAQNPRARILIMANHGIMAVGKSRADAFFNMYYFERAAQTYIMARQTGQKLRFLSDDIARQVAIDTDNYGDYDQQFLNQMMVYFDHHSPDYAE